MANKKQAKAVPPELIKAKEILDAVLAIKPSFGVGQFPPNEREQRRVSQEVYHRRLMTIYLELLNTIMEVRSEERRRGKNE